MNATCHLYSRLIRFTARGVLAALIVAAVALPQALAEDPYLLADQADGLIDVAGINRVEVMGIEGTLTLRVGKPGKLRFACRSLDNRREERAVSLWETESAMRLSFSESLEPQRLLLEVTVPPSMTAIIHANNSKLVVNNVLGDIEVVGTDLNFGGRNLEGDIKLEVQNGFVTVIGGAGDFELEGSDVQTKLTQIGGEVDIELKTGTLSLLEIHGSTTLDLEKVDVVGDLLGGALSVTAEGGSLSLKQARRGGTFELEQAPLQLIAAAGVYEVDTDSQIEFENIDGSLAVHSYGGGLSGTGVTGDLRYQGDEAEVRIAKIGAAATVSGDSLNIQVDGIQSDLVISATSSDVVVANADGKVDVTTDYGNVSLAKVAKAVTIVSRDGNVDLADLEGAANVKADGDQVTVHWSGATRDGNSSVENARGDVRLMFSPKGGGRLEAEASYGRIESSVPGVTVAEDGTRAAGSINRLSNPTIRVTAGGNVVLAGAPMNKPAGKTRPDNLQRPGRR